jgi:transaldolase/glucose-6-phosphate isomerase
MITPIQKLNSFGQSIWYDNIQRSLLERSIEGKSSAMAAMIDRGEIRGVTSNPSIFHHAIAKTNDYDPAIIPMAWAGCDPEQIFWQLAIEDIREACDLFSSLYRETNGMDGFVSLEVNPSLSHNTSKTLEQAKHLWKWVARPNLMVKIPATLEGLPAIRDAISAGININVTLIFSIERYRSVMEAYLAGLDARLAAGLPVSHICSVASFFVSRMDTKVDGLLPEGSPLRGRTAIAYTKLAYQEFLKIFDGERFARYKSADCQLQRPLWASTSTKDPKYPDTLYVNNLIGPWTVNTMPPQTLEAFRDHGQAELTLVQNIEAASETIKEVESVGISMNKVTAELEVEGVKTFADAFAALLKTIDERRSAAVNELGSMAAPTREGIASQIKKETCSRLWSHDPTLWTKDKAGQEEVVKRLGWLDSPIKSRAELAQIQDFISQIHGSEYKHILLLGMGGSSLAPEVLSLFFSTKQQGNYSFSILDSTDPAQILAADKAFPPETTLYIVSSKSGGTAEVGALFNYFWERTGKKGSHFIAITDPGTTLDGLANSNSFRKIFYADPTVGGRYSALTLFGLVPAAIMGIDAGYLLDRAEWMMHQCAAEVVGTRNPGLVLGAILGQSVLVGRDKLTILADESVAPFGSWVEQLVAESSGKIGKGIIPVEGEQVANIIMDRTMDLKFTFADRFFIYLRKGGGLDETVKTLQEAGHPALVFNLDDPYQLGAEFYRWEVATAVACSILGINAFDQPDVQDSKDRTRIKISEYHQKGQFIEAQEIWKNNGTQAFSNMNLAGPNLEQLMKSFLGAARERDYIAMNCYLPRTPEMTGSLAELRLLLNARTGCATILGYGPRFLHSTGQLHKGGPDTGLFLQITSEPVEDLEIPGQGMSFGNLERAQALGDYEALVARGRRVLRVNLPYPNAIQLLLNALK